MKTTPKRSSGVALVVTLILLSIITFMAVTFLVLSRSQRNMVASTTEQIKATKMAELGVRRGLAESLAPIKAFGNLGAADLRVSTNLATFGGFNPRDPTILQLGFSFDPLNVNYADGNGVPLTGNAYLQNIFNLYYSPRAPVYVVTNRLFPNNYDFRWYVDLNRNNRFETNGWQPEFNDLLQPITAVDPKGNVYVPLKFMVGDPEWVGVLEKPEYHHSASNLFVGRYAFIVLPASKQLDLNYVHNYSKGLYLGQSLAVNPSDGFMRNQGASTFEINLAGFLADLNTNYWPLARNPVVNKYWWPVTTPPFAPGYVYNPVLPGANGVQPNAGWAFQHAMGLVRYRYANTAANLQPVNTFLGTTGYTAFATDYVDDFASGPVMTGTWWPVNPDADSAIMNKGFGWPGSYNPYHFTSHQDLFDTNKTTTGGSPYNLTTALLSAGAGSNTYNQYTFYRMLAQLGTDTGPGDPESSRINLNYVNVDNNGNIVPNLATNFLPWVPEQFFTNAANRLFSKAGFNFGINGIQVYPTNNYSASVHRILQLAANIYDSTTNRTFGTTNAFPSVFRPIFLTTHTNGIQVFIVGYRELAGSHASFITTPPKMWDLGITNVPGWTVGSLDMVRGIPLVLGARKWFPNFNELELRSKIETTRKLSFLKKFSTDKTPYMTNEMFLLSITNEFGLEAWNSYTNPYPRDLQLTAVATITAMMSNQFGQFILTNFNGRTGGYSNQLTFVTDNPTIIGANRWLGFNPLNPTAAKASFLTPFNPASSHFMLLGNSSFSVANNALVSPVQTTFENGEGFPVPQWTLVLRTTLLFEIYDLAAQRIVDYVNLAGTAPPFDITGNLMHGAVTNALDGFYGSMFVTNRVGAGGTNVNLPTFGVINQIMAGLGQNTNHLVWNSAPSVPPGGWDKQGAINFFRTNLLRLPAIPGQFSGPLYLTNRFEAPYAPTRDIYLYTSWAANDPLVHYTVGDLTPLRNTNACDYDTSVQQAATIGNIGQQNQRYEPWPGASLASGSGSATLTDIRVKDPLVRQSSDWDFPTNKFPNPGWLGRIHRGTPWQTVYLKSPAIDLATWQTWTGNGQAGTNWGQVSTALAPLKGYYYDAGISSPTNDWKLLDLFTTASSDTVARGQLSINQTNLAAWSAVLSGVSVNPDTNSFFIIQPAGAYSPTSPPPVITLWNAINDVRRTNFNYHGSFNRLGDLLAVPELTVRSPFITTTNVTDAILERIPQQVLGLLKGGEQPRFVIYCYGQALKPAEHSRVTSVPFLDLCTNYAITGETAVKAVVRIEGAPGNPRAIIESWNVLPPD